MIPYFAAGQSFVVLNGNPGDINSVTDLCGKAVAPERGTVEADHIAGTGDYNRPRASMPSARPPARQHHAQGVRRGH